jgi:hypothetical protein
MAIQFWSKPLSQCGGRQGRDCVIYRKRSPRSVAKTHVIHTGTPFAALANARSAPLPCRLMLSCPLHHWIRKFHYNNREESSAFGLISFLTITKRESESPSEEHDELGRYALQLACNVSADTTWLCLGSVSAWILSSFRLLPKTVKIRGIFEIWVLHGTTFRNPWIFTIRSLF